MAWNQRKDNRESKAERRRGGASVRIAALAAVAVLCAAGIVWWRATNDDRAQRPILPAQPQKATSIPEIKPATASQQPLEATTNDVAKPATEDKAEARTLTPEEIEAEERRKDPLYDRHHIVAKMPLVKEPIEQLMLTVFETELGDMPPMLPAIPAFDEERFEKLVNAKTLPEDGDSKETLLSKELVNQVKAELAKYIDEGGTTSGFLAHYVNELDSAFRERETCKEMVMRSMKTDDPEIAREMFKKINERLDSKGIKQLTLTRRQKEHLGIED